MAQLRNKVTGALIDVADDTHWSAGVWECGAFRFTDPGATLYELAKPLLTPTTFYLAFTPGERQAIKSSTDANVKEFWETFQITSVQLGRPVDPNLISVQSALAYLATPAPNGPGILATPLRVQQILAGIPQ